MFYAKNLLSLIWITYKCYLTGYIKVYKRPQWVTCLWPKHMWAMQSRQIIFLTENTLRSNSVSICDKLETKVSSIILEKSKEVAPIYRNCYSPMQNLHNKLKGQTSFELNFILVVTPTLPYWSKRKYLKIAKGFVCRTGREHYKLKNDRIFCVSMYT